MFLHLNEKSPNRDGQGFLISNYNYISFSRLFCI